ncbi:hypothetical protein [Geosporobacter ferrireducens]|uniref:Uncharacterized protein n=1 Tax=Geosporobacter ferrireducens TaxID=1424294 RepID=A0A1D8GMR7_9FIRM|nr:hypothetical protein [Geosporobacter ferrireducens]AOT72194.1 hypothetical protein Gferi_23210 [Geosporobacter ferrireducens]MTI56085.1 hypothetical protein [Geosporobacter ferrireducens]
MNYYPYGYNTYPYTYYRGYTPGYIYPQAPVLPNGETNIAEWQSEEARSEYQVNHLTMQARTELMSFYRELEGFGIDRSTAEFLVRFVVSFTVNNAEKYSGTVAQKAAALYRDLGNQHSWIIMMMRNFGIPMQQITKLLTTLIEYVLTRMAGPVRPPESIDQRSVRITNQIREQTTVFAELDRYGVTASIANSIVRAVVLFTLRNSTVDEPPRNIRRRADEIYRLLEKSNLNLISDLRAYRIPPGQIRGILRNIIIFTLRDIYTT